MTSMSQFSNYADVFREHVRNMADIEYDDMLRNLNLNQLRLPTYR